MKKRPKAERGRAGKSKGAQPRPAATTPEGKALQESEADFRSLVESAAVPICISDLTGDLTYVNKALADLGGYTVQELVGHPFMDFVHPGDREVALSIFTEAVSTSEEVPEMKFRVIRRDGQFLTLTCKPTRIEIDGNTVGFQAIITDITERERMEEKVRISEERYRNLVENSKDSIVILDMKGNVLFGNKATEELTGYSVADGVGMNVRDITPLRYWPKSLEMLLRARTGKPIPYFESAIKRKDGHLVAVETGGQAILQDGKVVGLQIITRDITERKQAEDALQTRERQLSSIYSNASDVLFLLSVEPDDRFRFLSINQSFLDATGLRENQIVGRDVREVIPEPSLGLVLEKYGQAIRDNKTMRWEEVTDYPSGRKCGEVSVTPILDANGRCTNLVGTVHDITERKRMEQVLRDSEERYRELADSITDVFFAMDKDLRYTYWNEASEDLTGISAKDAIGKSLYEIFPDVKGTRAEEAYLEVLRTGQPRSYVNEYKLHGKQFTFEISAYPTKLGISVFTRDITERKQAEEKIRHLASFPQLTPASIVELDRAGRIIFCNPAATIRLKELGVGDDPRLYLPSDIDEILTALEQKRDMQFSREVRIKDSTFSEVIYVAQEFETVRIYASDITERKRAEEALRGSEERYRKLFEEAMDGIALADPNTGILLDCNQALAALVGRNRAELIGQHQAILHPPFSDDSEFSPTFKLHATTHEGQLLETQVITATGEIREVEIKASLLYLQGKKMLQGIFSDITERKQGEEALHRRAEELAALQATVLDITGHQDLPLLLQTIVERAARLLDAPAGGMYLCDTEKQEARCVVSYNTPHDYTGTVLKYGEGAAGIVAQTGMPLLVDDYRTWQGRATVFEEKRPFTAVLAVPVIWQGQVRGVIDVLDDRPQHFTKADQELLTLFANHAAIAAENTRMLEQEKRHAEELTRYSTNLEQLVFERTGKLAESERRFRELVDLLPQIVYEVDERGNFTFLNHIAFAYTGYTQADVDRGLNALQMFVPDDRHRIEQTIRRGLSGEKLGVNEYTALRKDGTTFPLIIHSAPIVREGKTVGLRGIAIDITDRKRAEEEIRAARERLEYVISSNPAVIFTGKPHSDLADFDNTYMSGSVTALLGYDPRDFVDDPEFWSKHAHPEDRPRVRAAMPRLFKDGHLGVDYRFMHKDGGYRWVHEEVRAVRDAEGNPLEVIGYWTDITERRRMDEELRAARERLEYAVASNPAVIYTGKPLADYSDWHLTYISESVVALLGFEPREFIGHPEFWDCHVPPEDVRYVRAEIPHLWEKGQHAFEFRFLHSDGTFRWIHEEARVVRDTDGKPIEVSGYWTDISERKRLEGELIKSQRLATIGETAAIVGHDLRNPLEAIAGATYLLRRQAAAGTIDDDGRESLQIIEKSIEYSDKIINDLLEYSTEIRLQTSTTDPKSVTDTALLLARIPENVRIVNETQAEPRMVMDADKIRRAFLNIIRNAVEAMPQGGTLTISSRRTDGMVEFKFADTGAGMSRETLENLWTPLFTTKARGMGFGLPITRRIVEAHGGTVAADSVLGRGSTFTVKVPVKAEAREVSGS